MNLSGLTALVTGANRGLGHAFTTELLALGIGRVYAAVRRPDTIVTAFPDEPRVVPLHLDASDLRSITSAVSVVPELHILVNNAATLEHGNLLDEDALAVLERAWLTNVRGPLAVTRAFLPALQRCRPAAVVQLNSIAALCPFPDVPAYAATKAAMLSLTQALRRELAPLGIPMYSALPGVLQTDMAAWLDCAKTDPRVIARELLGAVQRDDSGDRFPDPGAQAFWHDFKNDPARTLFVAPLTGASLHLRR